MCFLIFSFLFLDVIGDLEYYLGRLVCVILDSRYRVGMDTLVVIYLWNCLAMLVFGFGYSVTNGESRLGRDLFRLDGFGLVLMCYCFGSDLEVLFGSVLFGFGKWIS